MEQSINSNTYSSRATSISYSKYNDEHERNQFNSNEHKLIAKNRIINNLDRRAFLTLNFSPGNPTKSLNMY